MILVQNFAAAVGSLSLFRRNKDSDFRSALSSHQRSSFLSSSLERRVSAATHLKRKDLDRFFLNEQDVIYKFKGTNESEGTNKGRVLV